MYAVLGFHLLLFDFSQNLLRFEHFISLMSPCNQKIVSTLGQYSVRLIVAKQHYTPDSVPLISIIINYYIT